MRDFALLDEVCEDDPSYADACPEKAAIENYCKDQKDFMKKNCPKSCGFCPGESVKPPAPAAVCEDNPSYADACPEKAAVKDYCQDQENFMRKNCPKSCGFCINGDWLNVVTLPHISPNYSLFFSFVRYVEFSTGKLQNELSEMFLDAIN